MDRTTAKRLIRKVNNPNFNPDSFIESLGIEIPFVKNEPNLSDYGLTKKIILELEKKDNLFLSNVKKTGKILLLIFVIVGFVWGLIIYDFLNAIAGGLLGAFIGGIIYIFISDIKPKKTELHKKIEEYNTDKYNYEYWKRKKAREYWKGLSGHQFEDALAQVYRKKGYLATVSKAGGDEGIDIVLEKGGERIIVQCKAHSKPIGPVVARELYGVMIHFNISKAILASTSGFTEGVYKFVEDKQIELVTIEDIISMSS
ncbi:MAG: restriction endonuclease [Bacillota bacterium]